MTWKKIAKASEMHSFVENEAIEGRYVSKEGNQGQKKNSNIHTLQTQEGEVKFWGSMVLDDKLAQIEAEYGMGTLIRVVYLGKVKGKSGTEYKDFDVFADDTKVIHQD